MPEDNGSEKWEAFWEGQKSAAANRDFGDYGSWGNEAPF